MKNVPGQQVSGVDDNELKWITTESMDRYLYELSDEFVKRLEEQEVDIDAQIDEELRKIELASIPKSTLSQMNRTSQRFTQFLILKQLSTNLRQIPKHHLNNYLRYFYSELKTIENKLYSPPSLVCFRAALHRYFQTIRDDVNIISDSAFDSSNRMLKAMVKKYKDSNQPKEEDAYPVIEASDILCLYHHFDRSTPTKLQEEVLFNILYYFLLRGRETLPHLNKDSFIIERDGNEKKYIPIRCEVLSKNAKASFKNSKRIRKHTKCKDL